MTKQKELELYRVALKDWEGDLDNRFYGFCFYFCWKHEIECYSDFHLVLPKLYKHRTRGGVYLFHNKEERIQALKNAISELENELK